MKKIAFILIALVVVLSCKKNIAEKPEHLLSEGEMEDVLYDISLLQAIKSFQPQTLTDNNINVKTYIYNKYKIDSLTFAQNNTYYAGDIKGYEKIQKKVSERLKANKEKLFPPVKPNDKKGPAAKPGNANGYKQLKLNNAEKAHLEETLNQKKSIE